MKKIFKFAAVVPVVMVSMATMVTVMMKVDHQVDYDVPLGNTSVPKFTEMEIPFDHKIDPNQSLPFVGSAIIDVDNLDFVSNPEDLGDIINKIDAEINGLF